MMRWHAVINYATDAGICDVEHDIDELHELHDLVEAGPHWDTIESIVITRGAKMIEGLTVEKAEAL